MQMDYGMDLAGRAVSCGSVTLVRHSLTRRKRALSTHLHFPNQIPANG